MRIKHLALARKHLEARKASNTMTNTDKRPREHLLEAEISEVIRAADGPTGRYGARDAALILVLYRHGLRASEACALDWSHVDWEFKLLTVHRAKHGPVGTHPLRPGVLRALRAIRAASGPVFVSERGDRLQPAAIHKIVARAGRLAGIPFSVHPHMLRHSCGYALADAGADVRTIQHYLGHRNINSTLIYTALSPRAFENLWLE